MSPSYLRIRKRHIFASVFDKNHIRLSSEAANLTTPVYESSNEVLDDDYYKSQWDTSWLIVTQTLSLPKFFECHASLEPREGLADPHFKDALQILLNLQNVKSSTLHAGDIFAWFSSQVRQHYLSYVLPTFHQLKSCQTQEVDFFRCIGILEAAYRRYEQNLQLIKEQMNLDSSVVLFSRVAKFRRDLNAIISNTVTDIISTPLSQLLRRYVWLTLKLPDQTSNEGVYTRKNDMDSEKAERAILSLINSLKLVGLTGEGFQVIFAEVMNNAMSCFIQGVCQDTISLRHIPSVQNYAGEHVSSKYHGQRSHISMVHPSQCVTDISGWVEKSYTKLVYQVLSLIDGKRYISLSEKEKFKEIGISRLAELRTQQLFGIVENWPHNNEALNDLRTVITTPERRLYLTKVFANTLAANILQPAASTARILQTYISMIWSFHSLDHSKVLLDKVAYPLLSYLCTRDDTVRIVITSLLMDIDETTSGYTGEKLTELAWLLENESHLIGKKSYDEDFDWNDMSWVPDPVDAGPGYKRSKNADIIGTLVGVLGSREIFIKEFQKIIGDNFLKSNCGLSKEIKVMELLKLQFGEAPLQACEVMLKDIQDSQKLDGIIQTSQNLKLNKHQVQVNRKTHPQKGQVNVEGSQTPLLSAKILSKYFWPQLNSQSYKVPHNISEIKKNYDEEFESLKSTRKLTWFDTLGQATVELVFKDRTLVEEVNTWKAAVIWGFQSNESNDQSQRRTVQDIIEHLKMDEVLVRTALKFWVKKFVLYEPLVDTYTVRETLTSQERTGLSCQDVVPSSSDQGFEANDSSDVQTSTLDAKMEIYWQFILGMLTNSSRQMPLQQISMMLKTLVIDGFPYSNEELKEYLKQKIATGALEMTGGKYRLKK